MFYSLSKAFLFLLQPAVWLLILILWALYTSKPKLKRRLIWSTILLFMILGNGRIFDAAMRNLECEQATTLYSNYSYAVILGGYASYSHVTDELELNRAADRLSRGAALYTTGRVDQLIISSGVAPEDRPEMTEAAISADFLTELGLPTEDLILEQSSWNTFENALHTSRLLKSLNRQSEPFLLVTSAFHMDRAMACFKKQGLNPIAYPVDFHRGALGQPIGLRAFIPSMRTVMEWQVIIKEWVGMRVYAMRGFV